MDQTGDLGRRVNTDSRTRQKHCRLRTPKQGKSVSQGDLPTDPRSSARNFLGDSFKPSRNRQFQNSQNPAENKGKLLPYFYADPRQVPNAREVSMCTHKPRDGPPLKLRTQGPGDTGLPGTSSFGAAISAANLKMLSASDPSSRKGQWVGLQE